MVSKLLKSRAEGILIGDVLSIPDSSLIHDRTFRNRLEHYDERLKEWIRENGVNVNIGMYNVGPKQAINVPNLVYISHYDPTNRTFTFVDEDFDLGQMHSETQRIKNAADSCVKEVEAGARKPPFA